MQERPNIPPVQTDAERLRALARNLGSEKDIDVKNNAFVFGTREEADAFCDFAKEQGIFTAVKALTGGKSVRFLVTPEKQEKEAAPLSAEIQKETLPQPPAERAHESARERFERVLKGNFARVARGTFPLLRTPFTSLLIVPLASENGRITLNATFFYKNSGGQDRRATWSVFEDGTVAGRWPKDVPQGEALTRDDVLNDILSIVEAEGIIHWHQTKIDIIPEKDRGEERPRTGAPVERGERKPNDPERLRELERLPGFRFGFVSETNGFDGYRGAVVTDINDPKKVIGVVLDCEWIGNASFVVPVTKQLENPIPESPTWEEREHILAGTWAPIAEKARTRGQLLAQVPATRRFVHQGEWRKRIREAVEHLAERQSN